jgi:hypothetical protein
MSSNANELANAANDYICETCEDWSWCLPRALSQEMEDTIFQDLLDKGYFPRDLETASYQDWAEKIRSMIRYGIIRLDDPYTVCNIH